MAHQQADIEWRDGQTPVSTQFDDPYYSLAGGLAETQYVFLRGNGLPDRFRPEFHIAELGFGTGLSLLVALKAFKASGVAGKLNFTSFEAFPMRAEDMRKALHPFAELEAGFLIEAIAEGRSLVETDQLRFTLIKGDARQTLANWQGCADAWFLDGFSPAKNPELWEAGLMQDVAAHTGEGGTFATYTAAGFVRRNLRDAGFDVERVKGFGHKRHMSRGGLR